MKRFPCWVVLSIIATACAATSPHEGLDAGGATDSGDDWRPVPPIDAGGGNPGNDSGTSMPPPLFSDAGMYATPDTPGQVFCGHSRCGLPQMCCVDGPDGGFELTCSQPPSSCGGHIWFECDGPEDCADAGSDAGAWWDGGAALCCLSEMAVGSTPMIHTSCESSCQITMLCHSHAECPSDRSACCRGASFPLGHCVPPQSAMNGDVCDVP
jgi:hypothetical protein